MTMKADTEVVEGVHRVTQGITNFYLIEESQALLLVDAGTPKDWDVLVTAITDLGHEVQDLEAVLLTHSHADHTGFAERARTTADAPVWIHEEDKHSVMSGEVEKPDGKMSSYLLKLQMYRTMLSLGRRGAARILPVHEVSSFSDGEVLDLPGKPRVIHAPGHTRGSSALLMDGRGTLFAGDALTTWNPLTGGSGPQIMPSGMNHDSQQAIASLSAFEGISVDAVLPGHGDPWTGGVAEALRLARETGIT